MIRKANPGDAKVLAQLAVQMWEDADVAELTQNFEALTEAEEAAVFLLELDGQPQGFAQCQLRRDYVEGTETSPVSYLEGIFVAEGYRRRGYALQLLNACEQWAGEKGTCEFASDCELDNLASQAFHQRVGFVEANRIVCYTKKLG